MHRLPLFAVRFCAMLAALACAAAANAPTVRPGRVAPADVPGLVCFWDFQEEAGRPRVAKQNASALSEMNGPVAREEGGVFGPHAARLAEGQWFRLARADAAKLDLHGKDAQVTVVAWVKRAKKAGRWQAVAGVWDESRGKRQYCLFLDGAKRTNAATLERDETRDRVHGHVSSVGGPTPGKPFCYTYSTGGSAVPLGRWTAIAMTYDGKHSRVYVDGKLDAAEGYNPFPYDQGLFDGGPDGADFTVGSVSVGGKPGNFFVGSIGGLAVYDRALSDAEIRDLSVAPD